ncbi:MAG: rhodanese-like domain-containing protein [Coriobacteriia bacterium]|nr:rhodanese-like domain-containing protein [Coriobacteriia bacterium]MCL2537351.1 rhodanese-like domain-containing protein [Coriobacteriia bacterium]
MNLKKYCLLLLLLVTTCFLIACSGDGYKTIDAAEAIRIMEAQPNALIVDVRTPEEFAQGHIPGAILLPDYAIAGQASEVLPDKKATILLYCRSGNRSAHAAAALVRMGYTKVYDFGGLNTWTGELVTP